MSNITSRPLVNPNATSGTNGSVDGINGLKGFIDGSTPTTGYVGEFISNSATVVTPGTAGTDFDVVTQSFGAGTWVVMGSFSLSISSGTQIFGSGDYVDAWVTSSANSQTGTTIPLTRIRMPLADATGTNLVGTSASKSWAFTIPMRGFNLSTATTLRVGANVTSGAGTANYNVSAAIMGHRTR